MSSATDTKQPQPAKRHFALEAAFLSFLMPGLGQIYQGRIGKGLLFMACLYGMFFYGMYMGKWKNVYLPTDAEGEQTHFVVKLRNWEIADFKSKFLGNLWNRMPYAGQFWIGIAAWPALVHYYTPADQERLGGFQKTPSNEELNDLQREHGKNWDLGLVYTIVAGVLNILVIYDALAGPAFRPESEAHTPARQPEGVAA